jgi:hypothetical protein
MATQDLVVQRLKPRGSKWKQGLLPERANASQRVPGFNIKMNKYQTNGTYQQKKKAIVSSVSTCIEHIYALALTLLSLRRVPRLFGATSFGTSRTMVSALSLWSLAIRLMLKKDSPNAKVVDFGKRSLVASSFQSLSANTSMWTTWIKQKH